MADSTSPAAEKRGYTFAEKALARAAGLPSVVAGQIVDAKPEMAAIWATGELWLRVPESMKVVVTGEWPAGVTAKDFCLRLMGDLGVEGGIYMSVEFHGPAISALSLESRAVIPNMMAEFGAKTAYLPPDEAIFKYLEGRARRPYTPIYPDDDAEYSAEYHYDVSKLEPLVACPDSPDNVKPVSEV